jgi:hypothetical protein
MIIAAGPKRATAGSKTLWSLGASKVAPLALRHAPLGKAPAQVPANARSVRYIAREHRRWNQGKAEWWAERTHRFGRGGSEPQALLSFEIVTPFQMNQYLLGCTRTGKAAIIDCGCATASLATAKNFGLTIEYLLQTHAHIDHIAGLADIKQSALPDAPIYLHPDDLPWYRAAERQAEMFGMPLKQPPEITHELRDGAVVCIGEIELKVKAVHSHCYYSWFGWITIVMLVSALSGLSGLLVAAGASVRVCMCVCGCTTPFFLGRGRLF